MNENNKRDDGAESAGKKYEHVLISVSNPQTADQLVRLGCNLTDKSSVLRIMSVTKDAPFPERAASWRKSSQLVMDMTHLANRLGRVAKPVATTATSIPDAIVNAEDDINADLMIMGWFGHVTPLAVKKSRVVNKVLHKTQCDTVVLKSRQDLADVERIIVPIGGEANEDRLELVQTYLWGWPIDVVAVHVLTPDSERGEEEIEELLAEPVNDLGPSAEARIVRADSMVGGILDIAEPNDLIVVGPGREWVFNSFLFGRHADEITNRAPCSVLMYKSKEQKMMAWFKGLGKRIGELFTGRSDN
ncbi:MAG: universal stress protein [Planctomycetota bacterium]